MTDLKLMALDGEDLEIVSAHCQDAVIRVGDIGYAGAEKRFALLMNRFAWEALNGAGRGERRRAALRFERVMKVQSSGIDLKAVDGVLELLAVSFEPGDAPGGTVTLCFAGGGTVRLTVECLEAYLHDLGAAWRARANPQHALGEERR